MDKHKVPPPPPLPPHLNTGPTSTSKVTPDLTASSELIEAVKAGDTARVQALLDSGEDVNEATVLGTPLSVAVRGGNLQMVKQLISHSKSDVNVRDHDGEMPLCLSLRKQLTEISLFLLSNNCTIDCVDPVTRTSLLATAVQHRNLKIVEAMLAKGCDVNIRDNNNLTPLSHACLLSERATPDGQLSDIELKGELIKALYHAGADVNARVGKLSSGYLIHELVLAKCNYAINLLLQLSRQSTGDNRLDINKQNPIEKNTALNLAVAIGDANMVQLLLSNGADPNISNRFGDSPLSKAITDKLYDQSQVIKLLLTHGADPNFEDPSTSKRRKSQCKPLFAAIENGDRELVDLLLTYGADLSSLDYMGCCVVMPCLANGVSISLLHYIIDMMDRLAVCYDITDWCYLKVAFPWQKHLQYLIDKGLDINATNPSGDKIIHSNAIKFYPASLRVLLENGLHPDTLSSDGNSMLCMCAGMDKYWPAIQLLVQYGADINRVYVSGNDEDELSPLQRSLHLELDELTVTGGVSQVIYFINCGAVLKKEAAVWRDILVADRIAVEISEDESDSESSEDSNQSDSSLLRSRLLSAFEKAFSPLLLKMYCRNVIRDAILQANCSSKVMKNIYSLPLPKSLKDFLAFVNVPTSKVLR